MKPEIISYHDLCQATIHPDIIQKINHALLQQGIIGIKDIPNYLTLSQRYMDAIRKFCALSEKDKTQFTPNRDRGETAGYELGAEWFKDENDHWQIDDKKSSYYAFVPDDASNKWPHTDNFKLAYLQLGELIFSIGKQLLKTIGIDHSKGIALEQMTGHGRMLHYHKEGTSTNANPNWCGAHFDHGVFTGLLPGYYYCDQQEVAEPEEAGLYIMPNNSDHFEKVQVDDKSVLLFQTGEFAQLASHDQIRATKHLVKKARGAIERFTFALFFTAAEHATIVSHSKLTADARYQQHCEKDGSITYGSWSTASFEKYRAT